jgi:hypothetical protein
MNNYKKILLGFLAFTFLATSCTRVVYTHNDVMARYNTKTSIISRFGLPSEKRTEGDLEEWYYGFGSNTIVNTYNAPIYNTNSRIGFGNAQTYNRYIKFLIRNDRVASWESQGVNLQEVERDKKKTTWAWIGGGVLFGLLIAASAGVSD